MIKRFKKFLFENLNRTTLVEHLESLMLEEWTDNQIQKIADKPGFGEESKPFIKQFDTLRSNNRKEVKGVDINSFKTLDDLKDFLNSVPKLSKRKVNSKIKITNPGAQLVFENDMVDVYLIKTKEASCEHNTDTKWCITSRSATHWEGYTDKGITFYFIVRKEPEGNSLDKVAFAKYPENLGGVIEAYDKNDKTVNPKKIMKIFNLKESIFKEWINPNTKFITIDNKKFKYTEENGIKIYNTIDLRNMGLTQLPDFN